MPRYESRYDSASMPKNLEHVIYEKKGHVASALHSTAEARASIAGSHR